MTSKINYHGSCSCGAYKFSVALSPSQRPVKCNCAICSKKGALWLFPEVPEDFTVENDKGKLVSYTFDRKYWSHEFCGTCGVNVKVLVFEGGWPLAINALSLTGFDIRPSEVTLNDGKASGVVYQPKSYEGKIPEGVDDAAEIYHGSCHCGAVTYAASAAALPSLSTLRGHQEISAYGVVPVSVKKGAQFLGAFRSPMATYNLLGDNSTVKFCSICGVTVVTLNIKEIPEDHLLLNLKTLDHEGWETKIEQQL
ncbi:putative CENP-V/GFA domain-containing protein [Seiridium cardinale]|uniref:CENP-V/GFA domain-containing protein n=1 Tax=Seiridium cardinale TaxID=138064 RepID=A0ABR2XMF7_9PEZI